MAIKAKQKNIEHSSWRVLSVVLQLGLAGAIVVAQISTYGLAERAHNTDFLGLNFFSYFTIQSNIYCAIMLVMGAALIASNKPYGPWFTFLRGGMVINMAITALVYALLLQHASAAHAGLQWSWQNFIAHQLAPAFVAIEWLVWAPKYQISWRQSFLWLIYPVLWLIYTFIHAAITGWYPYPFLDPALVGGVGGVMAYVIGITVGFTTIASVVAWVSRRRSELAGAF
ncbi:MAG TPA: Pr6Pr family membrane protein [Candidatus Saccharimonadia bacterium]|nr:Pr6Pr family membrane protein [Candidatus Saccharimonadia bacterium]